MEPTSLGERELEVMTYLWAERSGTAAEVRAALSDPLAYTTVLTILRNLEAKGFVHRVDEGRAHRYLPRVEAKSAQRNAVRRLVDTLFGGSAEELLSHLVSERELSADELARIARRLGKERKP